MKIRLQKHGNFCLCGYCKETSLTTCGEDLGKLWREFERQKDRMNTICNNPESFYGLMWSTEGNRYCYLIGVETDLPGPYPAGTVCKSVTAGEYAVASVPSSQSAVDSWTEFYERALPDAGLQPAPGHAPDVDPVLRKLAALFGNRNAAWLDVDFSRWGSGEEEREKFPLLKTAILEKRVITFEYFSSYGQRTERKVEPLKLLFKGQNWYLYGFCRQKQDSRVFKITRMKNLSVTDETFDRVMPETPIEVVDRPYKGKMIPLRLRLDASLAFRIYDEFTEDQIKKNGDGSFTVATEFPEGEWVYGYIFSFGGAAEVLEPEDIRRETVRRLRKTLKQYESNGIGG